MPSPFNLSAWDNSAIPENYPFDPVSQAGSFAAPVAPVAYGRGAPLSQKQVVHGKDEGWHPSWIWVAPPGIGDAPQHVFATFGLIPFSVDGPGDRPASYLRSYLAPIVQNFAMRYQGMPVDGGSFLMTGLYTPTQMGNPSNDVFPGG
jgi:hypothetical protein